MQYITRICTFDSGHRVMNERMKCFNIHGHTYKAELTFKFRDQKEIGYAIDFKEIKRVCCAWIDDVLDHGIILNPKDAYLIGTAIDMGSKYWLMSLNGSDYCNPTAENISKEIWLAMYVLMAIHSADIEIHSVRLWETPNCFVDCFKESISADEKKNWEDARFDEMLAYAAGKGTVEYDDRKTNDLTDPEETLS